MSDKLFPIECIKSFTLFLFLVSVKDFWAHEQLAQIPFRVSTR